MRFELSVTACAVALASFAARAADTAAAVATPQAAGGPVLEQVIVNAKKRRQNVQAVPQTIDVVGGATLQRLSIQQFQDIQLLVSGLQLSDRGGQGQNISLRGITYDPDTAANPAVDVYINEVPISQTSTVFQDLYDVDTVEVIRGPQGTLRGRTSPAGAILINDTRPNWEKWTGYVQQERPDSDPGGDRRPDHRGQTRRSHRRAVRPERSLRHTQCDHRPDRLEFAA
jgi:iron complex outermembrane receptor protein